MSHAHSHGNESLPEPTIKIKEGWHCLHLYYQLDQSALKNLTHDEIEWGKGELRELLNPDRSGAPERMQTFAVSGHKCDLGVIMMDHDPLLIDGIVQSVRASALGSAFKPAYSFVSITEISEYVPTVEQYAEKLKLDGITPDMPSFGPRLSAYEQRLPAMNKQRLYPEIPNYPVVCFYPMNKIRHLHANWFMLPFSERTRLMAEHATSGIRFAGKISQLITASTGFDEWEWGVTLWGRAPEYIKEIVYTMRFDEASARYAEFGPFYVGYVMSMNDAFKHFRL